MASTPTRKDAPLPEPIRVRSVFAFGKSTAEEYAHMFNNYGGGVNPLGYKGHDFAPDGSYGYRHREPPRRLSKPSRLPTTCSLPPQPKPSSFDVGFDDEAVLSMPIPEEMRIDRERSAQQTPRRDDSCCPFISSSSGSITLPWACVTQSTVMNRYVYVTWRIMLLSLSLTALVFSFVHGVTSASLIVASAFTVIVMKEITISLALFSFYSKRFPLWKESEILWVVGAMFQIAAHVTLATPIVLLNNYLFAASPEGVVEFVRSPIAYFLGVLLFLVVFDILFTPLPPRLYGVLVGSLVIGLSGVFAVWETTPTRLLVALGILVGSSLGLGLLLNLGIAAVFFYFHEPRISRMLHSIREKEASNDTFSGYGYT